MKFGNERQPLARQENGQAQNGQSVTIAEEPNMERRATVSQSIRKGPTYAEMRRSRTNSMRQTGGPASRDGIPTRSSTSREPDNTPDNRALLGA
jgi:hypothetical protein